MEKDDLMTNNRLRKLNLNAPILSTRRGGSPCLKPPPRTTTVDQQEGSTQRVPFSWEQVPGTPKGGISRKLKSEELKPPKLPPCQQWHSSKKIASSGLDEDDVFSDAIDMLSMSESLEIAASGKSHSRGLCSLDLKIIEAREHQSPDFIIQKFLPDANALAETSYVPSRPSHCSRQSIDSEFAMQCGGVRGVEGRVTASKACGIGLLLFPRRAKQTVCGLKDPILDRQGSRNMKANKYNSRQSQSASVEVFCKGGGRLHLK
ncbi:hypothetical protein ACHQM5_022789 [Ranunculus cassubicifolius]